MTEISRLVGLKVMSIWVSKSEDELAFVCKNAAGEDVGVLLETYADCCSETWFADIVGAEALIGATIVKTERIDMSSLGYNVEDGRGRQDCDQAYGIKITSSKGWGDIVYRNSSNGYYGGDSSEEWFDAKGFPSPQDFAQWSQITSDWGSGESGEPQQIPSWIAASEKQHLETVTGPGAAEAREGPLRI